MDLILGRFADAQIETLSDDELAELEVLMELPDPDLYAALSDPRAPLPPGAGQLFSRIRDRDGIGRV